MIIFFPMIIFDSKDPSIKWADGLNNFWGPIPVIRDYRIWMVELKEILEKEEAHNLIWEIHVCFQE